MIFHTSNLHLLDSVGQGKIMCEANKRTSETKILFELTVLYEHQATMLQFSHLYSRQSIYMFCCLTPCEGLVTLGTRLWEGTLHNLLNSSWLYHDVMSISVPQEICMAECFFVREYRKKVSTLFPGSCLYFKQPEFLCKGQYITVPLMVVSALGNSSLFLKPIHTKHWCNLPMHWLQESLALCTELV